MANNCAGPQLFWCSSSYLHVVRSSRVERRARAVENFQFSKFESNTQGRCYPGMRRECTRMYGAMPYQWLYLPAKNHLRKSTSSSAVICSDYFLFLFLYVKQHGPWAWLLHGCCYARAAAVPRYSCILKQCGEKRIRLNEPCTLERYVLESANPGSGNCSPHLSPDPIRG